MAREINYNLVPDAVLIEAKIYAHTLGRKGLSVAEIAKELCCSEAQAKAWSEKPNNGVFVLNVYKGKFDHRTLPRELAKRVKYWAQDNIKSGTMSTAEVAAFLGVDLPCMYSWTRKKAMMV